MNIFKPSISNSDINTISDILKSGDLGYGDNVAILEDKYSSFSNFKYNVATNSASASAFMIFAYLKKIYGKCNVYTTSLGFVSPVWSAIHHGHNIIWVDVNENLLFDINDYKFKRSRDTSKNKSIVMPVLYSGVSNIEGFDNIIQEYDDIIVVDSAHCSTPTIKSDYTFFSFHPYKPIAASDGGMISTNNSSASNWFYSYRNFGRQTTLDSYDIVQNGFKFYMNNLNATIAITQLKSYYERLKIRKENYKTLLNIYADKNLLPHDEKSSYYFSTIVCNENDINDLKDKFNTPKHYPLLHKTKMFKSDICLCNTEKYHKFIINIPLYDKNLYYS